VSWTARRFDVWHSISLPNSRHWRRTSEWRLTKPSRSIYSLFNKPVLRRPIKFTQYLSIRYTERLEDEDAVSSVGSKGDSYDCASRDDQRPLQVRAERSSFVSGENPHIDGDQVVSTEAPRRT
jgi:hypothetical protein